MLTTLCSIWFMCIYRRTVCIVECHATLIAQTFDLLDNCKFMYFCRIVICLFFHICVLKYAPGSFCNYTCSLWPRFYLVTPESNFVGCLDDWDYAFLFQCIFWILKSLHTSQTFNHVLGVITSCKSYNNCQNTTA